MVQNFVISLSYTCIFLLFAPIKKNNNNTDREFHNKLLPSPKVNNFEAWVEKMILSKQSKFTNKRNNQINIAHSKFTELKEYTSSFVSFC